MAQAATFNDEIYQALRDSGMEERHAMRAARAIPPADSIATKADIADLRAAMPDRENFAAGKDVTVLQTKVTTVEAAIIRIDEKFDRINEKFDRIDEKFDRIDEKFDRIDEKFVRIDESIVSIKETAARTDEKVNGLQTQNRLFIIPLLLLTVGAMFGLLTKGILWAVAP
ncbi:MAG: hypothetical protein OXU96_02880 [Gammaproteobacteria bacterium]|nr:hypothetical protein [Gammaproteobacteria bacterium]